MSNQIKAILKTHDRDIARNKKIRLRKHLNADAMFTTMKTGFKKNADHRPGDIQHCLADVLMSGFAMFSLKDPSLPAFDERRSTGPHNLMTIYGMGSILCAIPRCVKFLKVSTLMISGRCLKMHFGHCNGARPRRNWFL